MITYFLNCMGPISNKWYEDNNIPYKEKTRYSRILKKELTTKEYKPYCGGRIDIHIPDDPYGAEYGVPIMEGKSWFLFAMWMHDLKTEKALTKEEIFGKFETETGHKIVWFNTGE